MGSQAPLAFILSRQLPFISQGRLLHWRSYLHANYPSFFRAGCSIGVHIFTPITLHSSGQAAPLAFIPSRQLPFILQGRLLHWRSYFHANYPSFFRAGCSIGVHTFTPITLHFSGQAAPLAFILSRQLPFILQGKLLHWRSYFHANYPSFLRAGCSIGVHTFTPITLHFSGQAAPLAFMPSRQLRKCHPVVLMGLSRCRK